MKYILKNDNLEVVGKQYLEGVGNYDGNTTNATDLATVVNNKANKSDISTKLSQFEKDITFDERYYTENEVDIKLLEITTKYTNLETKYNNLVAVLNKVLGVDFSEDFNSDFARDIRL